MPHRRRGGGGPDRQGGPRRHEGLPQEDPAIPSGPPAPPGSPGAPAADAPPRLNISEMKEMCIQQLTQVAKDLNVPARRACASRI